METEWFVVFQPEQATLCDGQSSGLCSAFVVPEEEFEMARCGFRFYQRQAALETNCGPAAGRKENRMEKKGGTRLNL